MQARPGHEIQAAENADDEKPDEAIGHGPELAGAIGQNGTPVPKRSGVITGLLAVIAIAALAAGLSTGVKTK